MPQIIKCLDKTKLYYRTNHLNSVTDIISEISLNLPEIHIKSDCNKQIELRKQLQITALIIQIDLMSEEALIENNIIYLSAGFDGPFVLQAFSVRKLPPPIIGLQMCLTDGKVYIGGKYICTNQCPDLQDYWLVEITAKFVSQTQPILIKSLTIVSTYPRKLLGAPPCTLTDHFNKQINKSNEERFSEPTKKIKYSTTYDLPLLKNSDYKKPAQRQKPSAQFTSIPPNLYKKREEPKPKNQSDKREKEKKLKIADSDDEQQNPRPKKQTNGNSQKKQQLNVNEAEQQKQGGILKNTAISELYERRVGWVILCRVNNFNRVECKDGTYTINFTLTDEDGDEIKCAYFQNPLNGENYKLEPGKYYSFSGGQIVKGTNRNDGQRQLQINFDINSTIIPRENVEFQLNLTKFCRIGAIIFKQAFAEVNVVGIIKSIRFAQQASGKGNKLKYSSTICDPITNTQIDLVFFLGQHEKPPSKGAIGFLHNYQLYKQNNVFKLNSTYKSYFTEQTKFKDSITAEFKRIKQEKDWQNMYYKNFSSVAFVFRTVHELKTAVIHTDDDKIYSLIDCWILDIGKKKFYYACKHCKKQTDKKDSGVYYCPNCRKNVESFYCHTLNVNFADYTSNISIDVIGEHADTLLQMSSQQFHDLTSDKQLTHLNCLRCKNVTIKLKTQKKEDQRKESHSVWGVENSNAVNALKQIKRRIQTNNIKINDKW